MRSLAPTRAALVHAIDQTSGALDELAAGLLMPFYRSLLRQDCPRALAMELVRDLQAHVLELTDGEPEEETDGRAE